MEARGADPPFLEVQRKLHRFTLVFDLSPSFATPGNLYLVGGIRRSS